MRTRKPAVVSRGDSCHRCTALLPAGAARCSMCGWPSGAGFPPADGDAGHSAAQLQAPTGVVQRQSGPDGSAPAPAAEPEDPAGPEVGEQSDDATGPAEATDDDGGLDPLTAPIERLTPMPDGQTPGAVEETPIAAAVAHDADHPVSSDPTTVPSNVPPAAVVTAPAGRAPSLARPAQVLIVGSAVLNLLLAGIALAFGSPIDGSMATVALGVALLALAALTAAAVTFLYWVSKAYAHVAASARYRQRHGPSMALVGWIIPLAGIVIGYRVLQDLWTGSNPETRDDVHAKPGSARVIDVWLLGLVTGLLFSYLLPMVVGDSALWSALAALGVAASALALASVISTVSRWQADPVTAPSEPANEVRDSGTVSTRVDDLEPVNSEEQSTPEPVASTTD